MIEQKPISYPSNAYSTTSEPNKPNTGIPNQGKYPFSLPNTSTKRNTDRFLQITMVMRQYSEMLLPKENSALSLYYSMLFSFIDNVYNRSPHQMCLQLAALANWFKVWQLSGRREQGDIPDGLWSVRQKAPAILFNIVSYIEKTKDETLAHNMIRLTNSILSTYKVLKVPVAPSLESITNEFTGKDLVGNCINFSAVFKVLGINITEVREVFKKACAEHNFYESMAAGPNGHAVWSAHLDAYELVNDAKLYKSIRALATKLGLSKVIYSLDNVLSVFSAVDMRSMDYSGGCHSKLHVLYEKGVKARIIAIGDYYSQNVLAPFHTMLSSILKLMPNDCTFDQQGGWEQVMRLSIVSDELNSLDLSKATDRLPRAAQQRMIEALIGDPEIGKLWALIMSDRAFVTENGHAVRYAVGQPMGFKSSFPAMALFHHCVVIQAALDVGLKEFKDYMILGDDIVIASNLVAGRYRELMALLGMEISPNKSVIPVVGTKTGAEFCSRLVRDGVELTGIPVNAIVEIIGGGEGLVSLWEVLHSRKLFLGQKVWQFLSIFTQKRDLQFLMMLNALPQQVSGLLHRVQYSGAKNLSAEAFSKIGITETDISNFYYYVLLSETMAKIDATAKRTLSWMSILETEGKTRDDSHNMFMAGTMVSLAALVNSQARKFASEEGLVHPIQDVVQGVGRKILSILNMFSGSSLNYKEILSSPLMSVLNFTLEKKGAYTSVPDSPWGNRRVLEKALRLLFKTKSKDGSKNISFTGAISGVTNLWLISATVGGSLVVAPHVPKVQTLSTDGGTRLESAANEVSLSSFGLLSEAQGKDEKSK